MLLTRPRNIPTKECECSNCEGWGTADRYTGHSNPNALTRQVECEVCEGTKTEDKDVPFIVYDAKNNKYLGWQDDEELPTAVSYAEACTYRDWDDACEDVSDFADRYSIQAINLVFVVANLS